MVVPKELLIGFSSGIVDPEQKAVKAGVESVLSLIPQGLTPSLGRLDDLDSWQMDCLRSTSGLPPLHYRLDLDYFWQEVMPHLMQFASVERGRPLSAWSAAVILTTEADLRSSSDGWLFGATQAIAESIQSVQLCVLSVARFRQTGMEDWAPRLISRLARHELGHALGLVPDGRSSNVEEKIGRHCTNVCSMRQGMSVEEFLSLSEQEDSSGIVFCPECLGFLQA